MSLCHVLYQHRKSDAVHQAGTWGEIAVCVSPEHSDRVENTMETSCNYQITLQFHSQCPHDADEDDSAGATVSHHDLELSLIRGSICSRICFIISGHSEGTGVSTISVLIDAGH